MLEAAIPVPPPSAPINSNTLINTSSSGMNLAISNVESQVEVDKRKKKGGPTTLTIVQDFPKKQANQASSMNLVQGREKNMNQNLISEKDVNYNSDRKRPITLSIVQDFPKKKHSGNHDNVEMVHIHGQNKDVSFYDNDQSKAPITLSIVQDFPKKNAYKNSHKNIEMIQEGPTVAEVPKQKVENKVAEVPKQKTENKVAEVPKQNTENKVAEVPKQKGVVNKQDKKVVPVKLESNETIEATYPSASTAEATAGYRAVISNPEIQLKISQNFVQKSTLAPSTVSSKVTPAAPTTLKVDSADKPGDFSISKDFAHKSESPVMVAQQPQMFAHSFKKFALMQMKLGEAKSFIENIFGVNN